MPIEFRYAALSDVGLMRKNNQDSGYAGQHLMVLADGMGGPAGGDIASSVAVAHLAPLDQDSFSAEELLPALTNALNDAHDELIARSAADSDLDGMGTTCIAVLRSGAKMAMLHIGDSRAYRLRDGQLSQVTTDHSFVQYLVDNGELTPEEAEHHPQKNVVIRILGDQPEELIPDKSMRAAVAGERWLLCSDGLSGVVSAETISEVLRETVDLDECAQQLVQLALKGGGPDNVTVVVFDIVESDSGVQQTEPVVVGAAAKNRSTRTAALNSSSTRAAALGQRPAAQQPEPDLADAPRPRRKMVAKIVGTLVFLAAIVGGLFAGYAWTQSRYYAIAEGDAVVIYQGIPQTLGPLKFSHKVEVTPYHTSNLSPALRSRLESPVTRSSRQELNHYLDSLVTEDAWRRISERPITPEIVLPTPNSSKLGDAQQDQENRATAEEQLRDLINNQPGKVNPNPPQIPRPEPPKQVQQQGETG